MKNHRTNIGNDFSYKEKINLNWLRFIIIGLLIISSISLAMNFLSDILHLKTYLEADSFSFAVITLFVFFLGYYGIKQKSIYSDLSEDPEKKLIPEKEVTIREVVKQQEQRYTHSGLKKEEKKQYLDQLHILINKEAIYLENQLSLKQVADRLGISANNLSQVINEMLKKNFFDFINSYRVEEVKKRLANPRFEHYSLLAIAYDSGFNSKSTFNAIFKKTTGYTPSQFQKKLNAS
ncbi:helix-turn-helix domain-containing protein [Bacteroidota bacterium]